MVREKFYQKNNQYIHDIGNNNNNERKKIKMRDIKMLSFMEEVCCTWEGRAEAE